jgi:heterodisulfide reductase subunit A
MEDRDTEKEEVTPEATPEEKEEKRIGVYVCHCGLNIGSVVDCKAVAENISKLDDVVVSDDVMYACSEPGQQKIKNDIKENKLNRVIVASCSPKLHEPTFRATCEDAGLNKYLLDMANIREQDSWVHLHEKEEATRKAEDLVAMSVARSRELEPQIEMQVPVRKSALVLGGGVAGIQTALDLGDSGYDVYLVEKSPSIGGRMAQIDKTFPTMDCSICILAPKMSEVGRHPNVTILTNAVVEKVDGYIGNFDVTVKQKSRFVTDACTACDDCVKPCPVSTPDEFDLGLTTRKAIYIPFSQAVPAKYLIDYDACLNQPNLTVCNRCVEACQPKCIELDMTPEISHKIEIGTIIVATGMKAFDPKGLDEYGYGKFTDVLTTLEFERLINAAGPTEGNLIKPSNRKRPENVAFLQCIGSRTTNRGNSYCSNICCMETIKDSLLIKEHWPEIDVSVFYMDIRAFGKGFEDLYRRAREEGIKFIRGLPYEITKNNGFLHLRGENTLLQEIYDLDADMVILSIGMEPQDDTIDVQRLLNLSTDTHGFFLESHPKLKPVDTATGGIFLAGSAEAPKDIKDSVTQASAAAARANRLMIKGEVSIEAITPYIIEENCNGCGACVNVCPYKALYVDKSVKKVKVIEASCSGCGTCGAQCNFDAIVNRHFTDEQILAQIDAALEVHPEEKFITFACNWCSYAGADFAGVSRMQYPTQGRVIRTMCSGRVSKKFITRAFEKGAGAVLVSGCHINDCHYINANYQTKKRFQGWRNLLKRKNLNPERLQLAWISAAEGERFSSKMKEMSEILKGVTKEEIEKSREAFAPKEESKKQEVEASKA